MRIGNENSSEHEKWSLNIHRRRKQTTIGWNDCQVIRPCSHLTRTRRLSYTDSIRFAMFLKFYWMHRMHCECTSTPRGGTRICISYLLPMYQYYFVQRLVKISYGRRRLVLAGYQTFRVCRAFDGTLPNALPLSWRCFSLFWYFPDSITFEKLLFHTRIEWLSLPFNVIDTFYPVWS